MRPAVDQAECISMARTQAALIVMREKLGLVARHVDVHGTVAFAALAGETQIERLLDRRLAPPAGQDFAFHHLEEQPRPAARAMLFFTRHAIARAHRLTALLPAVAYTHTAQHHA